MTSYLHHHHTERVCRDAHPGKHGVGLEGLLPFFQSDQQQESSHLQPSLLGEENSLPVVRPFPNDETSCTGFDDISIDLPELKLALEALTTLDVWGDTIIDMVRQVLEETRDQNTTEERRRVRKRGRRGGRKHGGARRREAMMMV